MWLENQFGSSSLWKQPLYEAKGSKDIYPWSYMPLTDREQSAPSLSKEAYKYVHVLWINYTFLFQVK